MVVKDSVNVSLLQVIPGDENVYCKIEFYGNIIVIGMVYWPQNADVSFFLTNCATMYSVFGRPY